MSFAIFNKIIKFKMKIENFSKFVRNDSTIMIHQVKVIYRFFQNYYILNVSLQC